LPPHERIRSVAKIPSQSRKPLAYKRLVIQTSPHILVVDDDQEIRRLLGRYLDSQGFRVTLAADRREFEKTFPDAQIDLVVLDVMLPDGSGLEICRNTGPFSAGHEEPSASSWSKLRALT